MKTITITFMQRVRLTLIMRSFVGTLGDVRTRVMRDLRSRIGISEEELPKFVRFVSEDSLMLLPDAIASQDGGDFQLTPEEARQLRDLLRSVQLRVLDMTEWADKLDSILEAACA
ncbi:MAG TPA: hypothetical protein VHC90_15160 [Bryobacteraceae bacterium]|nr:hypothetical protein [Bryobacteraceae bacterium]